MKITHKSTRQLRIQTAIFYLLILLAASLFSQLAIQTNTHSDWTATQRHSLSETTIALLNQIKEPVTITAFISEQNNIKPEIISQLERYQAQNKLIQLQYIDPNFAPDQVRALNIQQDGEIIVQRGHRQEHVYDLSEQSLTNALIRASREQEHWLIFTEGHGERPLSDSNFGIKLWLQEFQQKGFKSRTLNLAEHSQIPDNTAVLVIASPETAWLPGEINILKTFIQQGGNLLWLAEPDTNIHLAALAEALNIQFTAGTLIDPNGELLGIADPKFTIITRYADHPIAQAVPNVTLFPDAVGLTYQNTGQWDVLPLLSSKENVWSDIESSPGMPIFDEMADGIGPFDIGLLLSNKDQRIAIIGDGDFLSNAYLGNAGNLDLGIALLNWLVGDDALISIPIKTGNDIQLNLSKTHSIIIGLGFFLALPILLLSIGTFIWWRRRHR